MCSLRKRTVICCLLPLWDPPDPNSETQGTSKIKSDSSSYLLIWLEKKQPSFKMDMIYVKKLLFVEKVKKHFSDTSCFSKLPGEILFLG